MWRESRLCMLETNIYAIELRGYVRKQGVWWYSSIVEIFLWLMYTR